MFRVKRYLTCEVWVLVEEIVKAKSANPQWMCLICDKDADDSVAGGYTSLACDSCLGWYHLTGLGKKSCPKERTWICGSYHTDAHT